MMNIPAIISLSNPKSPEAEAYSTLRTNLQFSTVDHELQTILVTSPNASEGKTTTVTNLAETFAQAGNRVIVVDTDLRRPRVHKLFNLENQQGLTNVLAGQIELKQAITSACSDVHVMTSGPIPPNPAELLNSNLLKELLNQLKQHFDIILIDTPPVGVVTDAAILSTLVDGTLMVIASHQTESDHAVRAMKLLQTVGAKVLGTVLTKVPADRKGYYGYQYYEYHAEVSQKGHKSKKRRVR